MFGWDTGGSDFMVVEVESHEDINVKGEDVRVVGGKWLHGRNSRK